MFSRRRIRNSSVEMECRTLACRIRPEPIDSALKRAESDVPGEIETAALSVGRDRIGIGVVIVDEEQVRN